MLKKDHYSKNSTPLAPEKVANAALQAFFNLSQHWQLSAKEERILLGNPPESTFYKWKADKTASRLSHDTLERVSYLLGIYKALNVLLPSVRAADEWLRKPNMAPQFNGQRVMDRLLAGSMADLVDVRRYLDAQRGL